MVFHWILRDNKCPQVSWTLLSIVADVNNAVVWMDSILPLISSSSSFSSMPFGTVPCPPTMTDITVTFLLLGFFSSLVMSKDLPLIFCSLARSIFINTTVVVVVVTWNNIIAGNFLVWDWNIWYHITTQINDNWSQIKKKVLTKNDCTGKLKKQIEGQIFKDGCQLTYFKHSLKWIYFY